MSIQLIKRTRHPTEVTNIYNYKPKDERQTNDQYLRVHQTLLSMKSCFISSESVKFRSVYIYSAVESDATRRDKREMKCDTESRSLVYLFAHAIFLRFYE